VGVWAFAAIVTAARVQASRAVLVFVFIPSPFRCFGWQGNAEIVYVKLMDEGGREKQRKLIAALP
jgi:hypothetical protein